MSSAARAILDQLERRDWFTRCGQPPIRQAVPLASWAEAAASGCGHAWANILIEASNVLSSTAITTTARHERWNALAAEIKPRCAAMVSSRMASSPLARWVGNAQLPDAPANDAERQALIDRAITQGQPPPEAGVMLLGNLEWVILHAVIEAELAGKQPAGFFRRTADWILDGHFPCGWRGDLATGLPVVY